MYQDQKLGWWSSLSFRAQLRVVLVLSSVALVSTLTLVFGREAKLALLNRGLDLLKVSQRSHLRSLGPISDRDRSEQLTQVVTQFLDRTGLGESGETYLVDATGALMTPSRFTTHPGLAPVPSSLLKGATHWQGVKQDYRDIEVLGVWDRVPHTSWYLASEIDTAEILLPLVSMTHSAAVWAAILLLGLLVVAPLLTRLLSKNVERQEEMSRVRQLALFQGQEQERQHLSMELHDDLAPRLAILSWGLKDSADRAQCAELVEMVRRLSSGLSNSVIVHHGFEESCRSLFERVRVESAERGLVFQSNYQAAPGVEVTLQVGGIVIRVIQEALMNVLRHSHATAFSCDVTVSSEGVAFVVQDNGQGDTPGKRIGLGVMNMRQRMEALGGKFEWSSSPPGQGVTVKASAPLQLGQGVIRMGVSKGERENASLDH